MIRTILYFTLIFVALPLGQSDADFFRFKNLRSGYVVPGQTTGKTTVTQPTTPSTPSTSPSTPSTPSSSSATPTPTTAPIPQNDAFVTSGLPLINIYRNLHHADPLSSSSTLSTLAAGCAKGYKADPKLVEITNATAPLSVSKDVTTPCTKTGGGNELLILIKAGNPVPGMISSILSWDQEVYVFAKPVVADLPNAERKTQMLWKATKEVGWGCDDNSIIVIGKDAYVLCSVLFKPKGNVLSGIGDAGLKSYTTNVKDI